MDAHSDTQVGAALIKHNSDAATVTDSDFYAIALNVWFYQYLEKEDSPILKGYAMVRIADQENRRINARVKSSTHKVGLHLPHRVDTKVQAQGIVWAVPPRGREVDTGVVM